MVTGPTSRSFVYRRDIPSRCNVRGRVGRKREKTARNGHAGRYTDEVASRPIALRDKGMVFSQLAPPRFPAALYLAAFKAIHQENTGRIRSVHPREYDEVDARNDDGKFAIRAGLR